MIEVIKVSNSYNPLIPVILVGNYWKPLMSFIETNPDGPVQQGYMDSRALRNVYYVDDEREVPDLIRGKAAKRIERYPEIREIALTDSNNEFDWSMAIKLDSAFARCSQGMLRAVSHRTCSIDGLALLRLLSHGVQLGC